MARFGHFAREAFWLAVMWWAINLFGAAMGWWQAGIQW